MVKPSLLLSAFAMLVSVAVGASSRAKTYCKYLADTAQATIPLRETPDESNSTIVIPGGVVMKMVSELEDTLEYDTIYEFKAIYRDCKPSPAFFVDEIKVGPYSLKDSKIAFYNKGLLFGVDGDLAWIYTQLLWYNRDSNVAGGFNFISRSGVEIEDGKWVQECYTVLGWNCSVSLDITRRGSGEEVYSMVKNSTFLPAANSQESLVFHYWLDPDNPRA